ncbi:Uncharacterised protein [uncultured archaeon]|nr:Uncharacterised protein [uncultured archaeon]
MDPLTISLATKVMGVLMPYATKSAEEFVKVAGQAAYDKSKNLAETLKKRLLGDKEATDALNRFEEKPQRYETVLEDILKEKLSQDKALGMEMQKLLMEMGPVIDIIQKMKIGENVVGLEAEEMTRGRANITQEIEQAKNVTGAKIKHMRS